MKLQYTNLKISEDKSTGKWFIYYVLANPQSGSAKRKEYGKSYRISINTEPDLVKREKLAQKLMALVKMDLENGVDPKYRDEEIKTKHKQDLEKARISEEAKVNIATAIEWLRHDKGWINPVEGKENTGAVITMLLSNSFTKYLQRIGKAEDVREVTRLDISNYIEENFNRTSTEKATGSGRHKNSGWSSSSCSMAKARISLLFGALIDRNLIEVNPTIGVKIKKDSEKVVQPSNGESDDEDRFEPWTSSEVDKWFKDSPISDDLRHQNIFVATNILYYCFVRKSEILRLKCSMVNFDMERLEIPAKLTKSARKYDSKEVVYIDMPDALIKALKWWFALKFPNGFTKDDYILFQHNNTTAKYIYGSFNRHFEKLRIIFQNKYNGEFKTTVCYAIKHTGVIKLYHTLLASDKRPDQIQKILQKHCRHSDWNETENYLRKSCKIEMQGKREKINF